MVYSGPSYKLICFHPLVPPLRFLINKKGTPVPIRHRDVINVHQLNIKEIIAIGRSNNVEEDSLSKVFKFNLQRNFIPETYTYISLLLFVYQRQSNIKRAEISMVEKFAQTRSRRTPLATINASSKMNETRVEEQTSPSRRVPLISVSSQH